MRTIVTALVSAGLLAGLAGAASAGETRKHRKHRAEYSYRDNSPSAIYERQQHASTFDETQYYEQDSRKIPFGTAQWWRQKQLESGTR